MFKVEDFLMMRSWLCTDNNSLIICHAVSFSIKLLDYGAMDLA